MDMNERVGLSVTEAAQYVGVSPNHLRSLIQGGQVPGVRRRRRPVVHYPAALGRWRDTPDDEGQPPTHAARG